MVSPRRAKRFLTPEQKYDLWLRMLTGQISQADAAAEAGVDRTTIATLRRVAKDGAIAALTASTAGRRKQSRAECTALTLVHNSGPKPVITNSSGQAVITQPSPTWCTTVVQNQGYPPPGVGGDAADLARRYHGCGPLRWCSGRWTGDPETHSARHDVIPLEVEQVVYSQPGIAVAGRDGTTEVLARPARPRRHRDVAEHFEGSTLHPDRASEFLAPTSVRLPHALMNRVRAQAAGLGIPATTLIGQWVTDRAATPTTPAVVSVADRQRAIAGRTPRPPHDEQAHPLVP